MNKKYLLPLFPLLLGFPIFSPLSAHAFESTPASTPQVLGVKTITLYDRIEQAKKLLEPIKLNYQLVPQYKTSKATRSKKAVKTLSHYTLPKKDLALAVFNPNTGQTEIVMGILEDTSVSFPPQYSQYDIQKIRFNGVNTTFKVNKPSGGKVLALKYLITPKESGSKAEIENAMYSGVYVPYSQELIEESVTKAGEKYINDIIAQVSKELANKPSVSEPGKMIPETIKPELVRALVYAEHMDTTEFLNTQDTKLLADKVNVLLAGNKSDTWKYSVSSAGAAGISQFIPSTYKSLVNRHKDITFNPDFVAGMRDHVNALKATFVLLDDYIAEVRNRAPEHFLPGHAFDYGVAAYNGGPVRVSRAAKQYGATWYEANDGQLNAVEEEIRKANQNLASIRARFFASKDKKLRATLQTQADNTRAEIKELTEKRDAISAGTLRNETVNYVLKIHRLVQHFNSNPQPILASR